MKTVFECKTYLSKLKQENFTDKEFYDSIEYYLSKYERYKISPRFIVSRSREEAR